MDVNAATTKAVMMKSAVMFTYILYKRTIGAEYCTERFFLSKKFLKSADVISRFGIIENGFGGEREGGWSVSSVGAGHDPVFLLGALDDVLRP